MTTYRKPTMQPIGAGAETLYNLESKRNEIIKACAKEQGDVLGFKSDEFWTHSLPEQIASILGSFDRKAAEVAASAFLESLGITMAISGEAISRAESNIANLEQIAITFALYGDEGRHNKLKDAANFIKSLLPVS